MVIDYHGDTLPLFAGTNNIIYSLIIYLFINLNLPEALRWLDN